MRARFSGAGPVRVGERRRRQRLVRAAEARVEVRGGHGGLRIRHGLGSAGHTAGGSGSWSPHSRWSLLDALASMTLRFGLSFADSGFEADAERVGVARAASGAVFAAVFVSDFGFAEDAAAFVFAAPAEDEPSFRGASWLAAALA